MWKTTDRYVQQKRVKAVEAELKLKQVYVAKSGSNLTSPSSSSKNSGGNVNIYNGTTTNGGPDVSNIGKPCESCSILKSSQVSFKNYLKNIISFILFYLFYCSNYY